MGRPKKEVGSTTSRRNFTATLALARLFTMPLGAGGRRYTGGTTSFWYRGGGVCLKYLVLRRRGLIIIIFSKHKGPPVCEGVPNVDYSSDVFFRKRQVQLSNETAIAVTTDTDTYLATVVLPPLITSSKSCSTLGCRRR